MKLTAEEWEELLESDPVSTGSWRWGTTNDYVKTVDGKHWLFHVRFHHDDGAQDLSSTYGYEVTPVEVWETKWVPVPKPVVRAVSAKDFEAP